MCRRSCGIVKCRPAELAAEATRRPKPVHGVPFHSKFWAQAGDSEEDDSDDDELSTSDFINRAAYEGFSLDQLLRAQKALDSGSKSSCSSGVLLAKSIVSKLVHRKVNGAPWKGPLPAPRVSPPRTLGDATAKAAYQKPSPGNRKGMPYFPASSPELANPTVRYKIGSKNFEILNPKEKETNPDFPPLSPARYTDLSVCGKGVSTVVSSWKELIVLGPGKVFRPTKGLCALFARTGTRSRSRSLPLPPPGRSQTASSPSRSYAEAVKEGRAMAAHGNNGGFGDGGR